MEKIKITVEPRTILGKKIKKLRKVGILPANLFGKDIKSKSIQLSSKDFKRSYKEAGETGIVEVKLKDEAYSALIHDVQYDPVTGEAIHANFHRVNLKEKITANVPIKLEGESPAEKTGIGLILQTLDELEIESLPTDIPHEITVDISNLSEIGQTIHVKDLEIEKDKIEVKNDPEEVVVSVQTAEMKEEVVEEAPTPEEVEAIEEKGEETLEGEEGEKTEEKEKEKEQS